MPSGSLDQLFAEIIAQRLVLRTVIRQAAARSDRPAEFQRRLLADVTEEFEKLELIDADDVRKYQVRHGISKAIMAICGDVSDV